jgi:iron complex transport system substrate-binding protein
MASRRFLVPLLVPVLALALLACSGSSGEDEASAGESGTTEAAGDAATGDDTAYPLTVEHRFGATEITERPERIVSLDWQWTDVLASLDAPPVAHLVDPTVGGDFPWDEGVLEGSTTLEATPSLPREQIIAADPDLIVVTYLVEDQADYDALDDIAPTIATLSDSQVDTWQDIAGAAGRVLGEEDAAAALVDDVEGEVQAVADALPGLEGKTFTFANYVPGDAMYVLSDPEDGANVLFGQLGMEIAPAILEAEDDSPGRVKLSLENIDMLDADLVMVLTNGADTADIPGFDELPAVEAGAALVMGYEEAVALNTPTPLSIPWVLDTLRPALEAAAQG